MNRRSKIANDFEFGIFSQENSYRTYDQQDKRRFIMEKLQNGEITHSEIRIHNYVKSISNNLLLQRHIENSVKQLTQIIYLKHKQKKQSGATLKNITIFVTYLLLLERKELLKIEKLGNFFSLSKSQFLTLVQKMNSKFQDYPEIKNKKLVNLRELKEEIFIKNIFNKVQKWLDADQCDNLNFDQINADFYGNKPQVQSKKQGNGNPKFQKMQNLFNLIINLEEIQLLKMGKKWENFYSSIIFIILQIYFPLIKVKKFCANFNLLYQTTLRNIQLIQEFLLEK